MYKKKVAPDLGPIPHTAATIRKVVLTPPPDTHPHTPKKGVPGYGGLKESKTKNSLGNHFLS